MKFTGAIACGIVAWDCIEKATGLQPQVLLSADALWVWWFVAALWAYSCVRFITAD
jgi:hypothetical protein